MAQTAATREALDELSAFATADEPMAPHTTYRLGGPAAVFAAPRDDDELLATGEVARRLGLPVLVLGRGSNLLVADEGFCGVVVTLSAFADHVEQHGTQVVAGGAAALPVVARRTAAWGLTGFEWAVGVPGSIGGAVRMNAGGHGSDMAACTASVTVVDLLLGRRAEVPAERLGLRFRGSDLAAHQVVTSAQLQLAVGDPSAAESAIAEIVRWRREHQPGGQNAGSVFVNPVPGELPAARLIDDLGLRGLRIGGAWVSEKHANFIQAGEGATAADVRAVMEQVRATVHSRTGIALRSEVRLVGFADVAVDDERGVEL